ncbi:DUF2809 domain-containing protein [Nonomuraea sp. C10]|nr:DUF2809 domain-containing protein [Nonomuraea sp. C10]
MNVPFAGYGGRPRHGRPRTRRPAALGRPWAAALTAAGLSWAIEFTQLLGIPVVLRPLLGSTFNPPDLFWYAAGAATAWAAHIAYRSGTHG